MAERIQNFTKTDARGYKYPWDEWADGSCWRIKRGEDFETPPEMMRGYLSRVAASRGLKVKVHKVDEATLEFQFYEVAS